MSTLTNLRDLINTEAVTLKCDHCDAEAPLSDEGLRTMRTHVFDRHDDQIWPGVTSFDD